MSIDSSATASAAHWNKLADESERMAAWNREHGLDLSMPGASVGAHQAKTYRQTAKALQKEADTGVPHCHCHLAPLSSCPMLSRRTT